MIKINLLPNSRKPRRDLVWNIAGPAFLVILALVTGVTTFALLDGKAPITVTVVEETGLPIVGYVTDNKRIPIRKFVDPTNGATCYIIRLKNISCVPTFFPIVESP